MYDTVNTASRIESHGASGEVNISTLRHAILQGDSDFVFQERQELEVKGKGLMKMYFVSLKQKA
ncbi:MAG: adenylate/guanylate cyclase domain-containing protein [Bacteroidetes bacterium]|nr:adenylate/guanylate cyclase domain-containing protein [Bacteroidota bacterium]